MAGRQRHPGRILPNAALVLALTPLVDPRFVVALFEDLRGRRYDVAVVEVNPVPLVRPGRSDIERAAYRLWLLESARSSGGVSGPAASESRPGMRARSTPCSRR